MPKGVNKMSRDKKKKELAFKDVLEIIALIVGIVAAIKEILKG